MLIATTNHESLRWCCGGRVYLLETWRLHRILLHFHHADDPLFGTRVESHSLLGGGVPLARRGREEYLSPDLNKQNFTHQHNYKCHHKYVTGKPKMPHYTCRNNPSLKLFCKYEMSLETCEYTPDVLCWGLFVCRSYRHRSGDLLRHLFVQGSTGLLCQLQRKYVNWLATSRIKHQHVTNTL